MLFLKLENGELYLVLILIQILLLFWSSTGYGSQSSILEAFDGVSGFCCLEMLVVCYGLVVDVVWDGFHCNIGHRILVLQELSLSYGVDGGC